MTNRDRWVENLRCPQCGKLGQAELSMADAKSWIVRPDSIPAGFKVVESGNSRNFYCVFCDLPVAAPSRPPRLAAVIYGLLTVLTHPENRFWMEHYQSRRVARAASGGFTIWAASAGGFIAYPGELRAPGSWNTRISNLSIARWTVTG